MKSAVFIGVALLVTTSVSHAQTRGTPHVSGVALTGDSVVSSPSPVPATTGLGLSVRPQRLATGGFRWADYPLVHEVYPGTPAARLGIRPGDQVLSANGVDAREPGATRITHVGQRFVLRIRRGNRVRNYTIVTVPNPPAR